MVLTKRKMKPCPFLDYVNQYWDKDYKCNKFQEQFINWTATIPFLYNNATQSDTKRQLAIRGAAGGGKSFIAADFAMFCVRNYKDVVVISLSITRDQSDSTIHRYKKVIENRDKIPELPKEQFIFRNIPPGGAKKNALRGIHPNPGSFLICVADECNNHPPRFWEALAANSTQGNVINICIGNGGEAIGGFYNVCEGRGGKEWSEIHFNVHDIIKYGEKEKQVELQRLGEEWFLTYRLATFFNLNAQKLINDDTIMGAFKENDEETENADESVYIGVVPPNTLGKGKAAIVVRKGLKVLDIEAAVVNHQELLTLIGKLCFKYNNTYKLVINASGIRRNIYRKLINSNINAISFIGSSKASEEGIADKRTECYFKMKNWFESGGKICFKEMRDGIMFTLNALTFSENDDDVSLRIESDLSVAEKVFLNVCDALSLTFFMSNEESVYGERISLDEGQEPPTENVVDIFGFANVYNHAN